MQQEYVPKLKKRDIKYLKSDLACAKAIAQAAINVELFTIPLYMTSLYSIKGMHQINSKDSTLYAGRWWPGAGPVAKPSGYSLTTNENVFNKVYSIFIGEMLHLQLASNMASTIGVTPRFTSRALQSDNFGWHCYKQGSTQIPHILDFTDWKGGDPDLSKLTVELRAMDQEQLELFLAIEETAERGTKMLTNPAVERGDGQVGTKYFEAAPFNWFTAGMGEMDLPLFGSIGHMYLCYWDYLEIEYNDGSHLLSHLMTSAESCQRDQFNNVPPRAAEQYPGIEAKVDAKITDLVKVKLQLINNINAITDQGEGADVVKAITERWQAEPWVASFKGQNATLSSGLGSVQSKFQPSEEGLIKDYPGYDDQGNPTLAASGSAQARFENGGKDHFELFAEVKELITKKDYMTWDVWHKNNPTAPWESSMLGKDGAPNLPATADIAAALNRLGSESKIEQTFETFSLSAVGTIKGITTSLDQYWQNPQSQFPSPAMGGSGDRISICWSVTGRCPDLVTGIDKQQKDQLYHACQGMAIYGDEGHDCAAVVTYHSCKGSNECKTQGGCGFVQSASGGGNCSSSAAAGLKSAPADNLCGGFGGCAVPISASQLYPAQSDHEYSMQLYKFGPAPDFHAGKIPWPELVARDMLPPTVVEKDSMPYRPGEAVYDVAWRSYCAAKGLVKVAGDRHHKKIEIPASPAPNDIRLVLPPST
ncbi:ferritin-like domain-containing protein [Pseudoalteromonas ostreae]|uniref:ferritin-like domain-containing protein n=1 Tax=Pseudoalteromonas ostreae TaxID=2774154 RepID=UPI001B37E28E|nr:ferritin-like domain-containing protein [Pseudoalteromonas ostreae]